MIGAISLGIAIAGYLVSVWLCHDFLLKKEGIERYELLILAVLVLGIPLFFMNSIPVIGGTFIALNVIRLFLQHTSSNAKIKF